MINSPTFIKNIKIDQPLQDIILSEFDEMMVLFTIILKDKTYNISRVQKDESTFEYLISFDSKDIALDVHNYLSNINKLKKYDNTFSIKSEQCNKDVYVNILKE